MNDLTVEGITASLVVMNQQQALALAFQKLVKTDNFKAVFSDFLLTDRVKEVTDSLMSVNLTKESEAALLDELRSLRYLNTFIASEKGMYDLITKNIKDTEELRTEISQGRN